MASAKQQENMLLTEHFTWPPIVRLHPLSFLCGNPAQDATMRRPKSLKPWNRMLTVRVLSL
jgi:hypothetical protein